VISAAEWAWQRQSVWSQTANKLKNGPSLARTWQLVLTVAAAVLALAASQVKGASFAASLALSVVAAVALATVSVLRAQTSKEQVQRWTRARSVSEAIKTEVYTYLSGSGRYAAANPDIELNREIKRLEDQAGDLNGYTSKFQPVKRELPPVHDVDSYLQVRVREMQLRDYYEKNARDLANRIRWLKWAQIALALVAAALAAVASVSPSVGAWAAVATTAGGAVAAYFAAERYEFLWIEYSRTASELHRLLSHPIGADGHPLTGSALVAECEQVISVQNQAWMAKWGEDTSSGQDG
jgi:membrane protein YdbS with pleckstrin-like domain